MKAKNIKVKNQIVDDLLKVFDKIRDVNIEVNLEKLSLKSRIKYWIYKKSTRLYLQKNIDKQNHINSVIFELLAAIYRELLILRRESQNDISNILLNFFDEEYFNGGLKSSYRNYNLCQNGLEEFAKVILKEFKPEKFLEIGCAYGFIPQFLRKNQVQAFGIDISNYAIRKGNKPYLRVGDVRNMENIKESKYDVVLCSEVLEHVSQVDIEVSLRELWRVTSRWLILTINLNPNDKFVDLSHVSILPKTSWERLFQKLLMTRNVRQENTLKKSSIIKRLGHKDEIFVFEKIK